MSDERRNGTGKLNVFLVCLLTVGVGILVAGIPWAYNIQGRLTEIETLLRYRTKEHELINEMDKRLIRVELGMDRMEDQIRNIVMGGGPSDGQ